LQQSFLFDNFIKIGTIRVIELIMKRKLLWGLVMNKKYPKYSVFMLFLFICNPSFSMDHGNMGYGKRIAKVLKSLLNKPLDIRYEDASKQVQAWARKELRESNIDNAETVLLKRALKNEGWHVRVNTVFIPETFNPIMCSQDKRLRAAYSLKHEMKHSNNNDAYKASMLLGATAYLGLLFARKQPMMIPLIIPLAYGVNCAHTRYQEAEADQFAFKKAKSKDELIAAKKHYEKKADLFEAAMSFNPNDFLISSMQKKILSIISHQLKNVVQSPVVNKQSDFHAVQNKKMTLLKLAYFVLDQDHPYSRDRANMTQDFIDKWDKK